MLCRKPFYMGQLVPCAKCLHCRINQKRIWVSRLELERFLHKDACFATLTYSDDSGHGGQLVPKHVQDWLKRLRASIQPKKIRFFLVGEYGLQTARPHYHALLFGIDRWLAGGVDGRSGLVQSTWNHGFTYVGDFNHDTAAYVCGYVLKKLTQKNDIRTKGKLAQFNRMSLRPGIGKGAVPIIKATMEKYIDLKGLEKYGDVPTALQSGRSLPLGRYLRRKLRLECGFASENAPKQAILDFRQKMQGLLTRALNKAKIKAQFDKKRKNYGTRQAIPEISVALNEQKLRNQEAKFELLPREKI